MNMKLNTIYGNWTTRGLADAAKRTKTKHGKSPVASASCPVRELAYQHSASCPVTQFIAIAAMFV